MKRRGRAFAVVGAGALVALALCAATTPAQDEGSSAAPVRLTLQAHDYSLGRADAPLTIVEFTDYQCPFCRRFHAETWPQLKREWVDTGKVRFVVRDLPLAMHAAARPAAEVAHCAGAQGRFWPMHDALLAHEAPLTEAYVLGEARALGLDAARLRECASTDRYEAAIARNAEAAAALGIHGTPTFIVGVSEPHGLIGVRLSGAQPYEVFERLLTALMKQLPAGGS